MCITSVVESLFCSQLTSLSCCDKSLSSCQCPRPPSPLPLSSCVMSTCSDTMDMSANSLPLWGHQLVHHRGSGISTPNTHTWALCRQHPSVEVTISVCSTLVKLRSHFFSTSHLILCTYQSRIAMLVVVNTSRYITCYSTTS